MTRDEQIVSLKGQVVGIARRLGTNRVTVEELIGEGWLGAIRAVDRFKSGRSKLSTFAEPHIRGAMLDYFRRMDPLGRQDRKDHKARTAAAREAGREEPAVPVRFSSLDKLGRDSERTEFEDRRACSAFDAVEVRFELRLRFKKARGLTARERDVLMRHYIGEEDQVEIARSSNIHESRVSQLKKSALDKLRAAA